MTVTKPKQSPKVSIIVLNWNGKSVTSECLDSLYKVNYDNFDVILVDNGSEDGSQLHFKKNYSWTMAHKPLVSFVYFFLLRI